MTPELLHAFVTTALTISMMMLGVWLVSLLLNDVSIVDMVWGLGFVLTAWSVFLQSEGRSSAQILLLAATSIWGLRLSFYLTWRNLGKPEDFRYRAMRERRKWFPISSLCIVFGLQGIIMWMVSLPIQAALSHSNAKYSIWAVVVGVVAWALGLFFETVGDWQLARFKADPQNAGQVMDRGLWRYTRHPNYFGDFLVWWGLFLIAVSTGLSFWWSAIGPLLMSVFLLKVSGVTLLEKSLVERRAGYRDYISRTSAFFPRRPRES